MNMKSCFAIFALAILQSVSAQSPVVGLSPSNLQGQILGTGSDGTTFALSGEISGEHVTATIVQGATRLSEVLVYTTSGITAKVVDVCGYSSITAGETAIPAECTGVVAVQFAGGEFTSTAVTTGTISVATGISTKSASNGAHSVEWNIFGIQGALSCIVGVVMGGVGLLAF